MAGHHALVNAVVAEPERPGVHHDGLVGVVEEGVHGEVLVAHRIELIVEPSGDCVGFVPPIAVLSHFLSALLAHPLPEQIENAPVAGGLVPNPDVVRRNAGPPHPSCCSTKGEV